MSHGMNEGQKARTRDYLDDFKANNGGCIICGRKIGEYCFRPAEAGQHIQLMIYGSCTGHYMVSNSDELLDEAVVKLAPNVQEVRPDKPVLVVVSFNDHNEDLKFAAKPKG